MDDSFLQFIEALKVNTSLTGIDLSGTFKLFHDSPSHLSLFAVIDLQFSCLNCLILGNEIDNDDAKYIADVLKVNTTLTILDFGCELISLCFFFFFCLR